MVPATQQRARRRGETVVAGSAGAFLDIQVKGLRSAGLPISFLSAPAELWQSSASSTLHARPTCQGLGDARAVLVEVDLTVVPAREMSCYWCGEQFKDRFSVVGRTRSGIANDLAKAWTTADGPARRDALTAVRNILQAAVDAGETPPLVADAARGLVAAIDIEFVRADAARVASQHAHADTDASRVAFALVSLFGVCDSNATLFAPGTATPSIAAVVTRNAVAQFLRFLPSGDPQTLTLGRLRALVVDTIRGTLPAAGTADDVGLMSLAGSLGPRIRELLAGALGEDRFSTVGEAALHAETMAAAETAERAGAAVFDMCCEFAAQLDMPATEWQLVHVADLAPLGVAYSDQLRARFAHHVGADGSVTALVPAHLVPPSFTNASLVSAVAAPDGFDPARLDEYAAVWSQMPGGFPDRAAAALALVD